MHYSLSLISLLFIVSKSFFLFVVVTAQHAPELTTGVLPQLFVHGDHFSVGQQIGYTTKDSIKFRLINSPSVQSLVTWVTETAEGKAAYDAMFNSANETFPEYVLELVGMSYGSGVDFVSLFTLNVRKELSSFKKNGEDLQDKVEHCSDYLVNALGHESGNNAILIGHNEVICFAADTIISVDTCVYVGWWVGMS